MKQTILPSKQTVIGSNPIGITLKASHCVGLS